MREGNLEAPTRHPIDWKNPDFYDEARRFDEMERIFDICHGCRRCVSLCQSFPTLFDLVDARQDGEVDGVDKKDYWKVVDQCYLCDLCYMTKCPYVPPHPWNVDFPHTDAARQGDQVQEGRASSAGEKLLASTDVHGQFAGIPIVVQAVNAVNRTKPARKLHGAARSTCIPTPGCRELATQALPLGARAEAQRDCRSTTASARPARWRSSRPATSTTTSRASATTCSRCSSTTTIPYVLVEKESCCGMPKLELGDLDGVDRLQGGQHPGARAATRSEGYAILTAVPVVHADVQAGTAADVPGRRRRAGGARRRCWIRSSTSSRATATAC